MDLLDYMNNNGRLVIAEGMLFELMRRGRVKAGSNVPEVVVDNPEMVRMLHQEFVDAGSDVVQAFTYYAHRTKLRSVGREDELEKINTLALKIAKEVARKNNKLFAGGLCNSNIYDPSDPDTVMQCEAMFTEQCQWAKQAGVDFMIAESFWDYGEASLALRILKEFGFTTVVTLVPAGGGDGSVTFDGVPIPEALSRLEEEGADVVGLNCQRGPRTMIPLLEKCRAVCKGPLGCLPVCYRTDETTPTFSRLKYPGTDESCYPHDVHIHASSSREIEWYGQKCVDMGVEYVGLCCGNNPSLMHSLSKSLGRITELDKYAVDREVGSVLVVQKPGKKRDLHKFTMK